MNKQVKRFSFFSVVIFVTIVLVVCFSARKIVRKVAGLITGSVDYASSIVRVTPDGVNIADLIVVDDTGVQVGGTRVDFGSDGSDGSDDNSGAEDSGAVVSDGMSGDLDAVDVTEAGFRQTRYTYSADQNRALDISVSSCDVVIAGTDTDSIIVDVLESDKYKYRISTSDNTLVIRDGEVEAENETLNIFGIKIPAGKKRATTYTGLAVIVYLPTGFDGKINVNSTDGSLKLGNLTLGEELSATTTNGTVSLSDIDAYDITASTSDGRLSLANISATEIKAKTSSARITAEDVTAKRLTLTTSGASIDFSRLFGEKFDFTTDGGDITGSILGDELLYSIETETDRTAYPKSKENERAKYRLTAKTTGGDIDISFAS